MRPSSNKTGALAACSAKQPTEAEAASCAPVYMLLDDVLKLIFEDLCIHKLDNQDLGCIAPHHDPMPITHVSRRWRAVALALPTIWRCIHLGRSRQLLQLWIERSAKLPIRVFGAEQERKQWGLEEYFDQIRVVLRHAPRLQHFSFCSRQLSIVHSVCALLAKQDLPVLRTLVLRREGQWRRAADIQLPTCPNLTSLRLTDFMSYSHSFFSSQLPHLEALELDKCGFLESSSLRKISETAPALVKLTLKDLWYREEWAPGTTTFSNLWTLVLAFVGDCRTFTRSLELPSLQTLVLHRSDGILHSLADANANTHMLPLLKCLEVTALFQREEGYSELLHFLEKGASSVFPLKELRLGQRLQEELGVERLRLLGEYVAISTAEAYGEEYGSLF